MRLSARAKPKSSNFVRGHQLDPFFPRFRAKLNGDKIIARLDTGGTYLSKRGDMCQDKLKQAGFTASHGSFARLGIPLPAVTEKRQFKSFTGVVAMGDARRSSILRW